MERANKTHQLIAESNIYYYRDKIDDVTPRRDAKIYCQYTSRPAFSTSRKTYSLLDQQLPSDSNYFSDKLSADPKLLVSFLNLFNVNSMPPNTYLLQICSPCNKRETKNIYHFIAICSISQEIRRLLFNENCLSQNRLYETLDSVAVLSCSNQYKYCKQTLVFRNSLLI